MASQTDTRRSVIPYAPKGQNTNLEADPLDRAGSAILGLINQAADTTEADLQTTREAAEKLADQLRAAQARINQLEANVRYYQIGQIALRNGCIKFRRRSSKDFLELTVVAPLVGVHRHNTEIGSGHLVVQLVGGRNEYSLDHHNWVCGRDNREADLSWKLSMNPPGSSGRPCSGLLELL